MNEKRKIKVLFVCIGNSCRSPMAESILKEMTKESNDWEIDSAALADWNVGLSPEPRCLKILTENGLWSDHISRQIGDEDFFHFDYIFGMDNHNIEDLQAIAPKSTEEKIHLLGNYSSYDKIIFDPYFVSISGIPAILVTLGKLFFAPYQPQFGVTFLVVTL